jgi:zinc transport system substrate-binding protein
MRIKKRTRGRTVAWIVAGLLLLLGCSKEEETGKPRVVCSLFPLYEFARAVGGDKADVRLLLPPGVEPHAWEPKAGDMVAISNADLFLCVSKDLEPWANDIVKGASGGALLFAAATEGIESLGEESRDPHIWLDLRYDQVIVERIARALSSIDPDNEDHYRQRARAYNRKLLALDQRYEEALATCRHRYLLLGGHSAFSHLARRYGLREIPLYGVSADSEPTPRRLAEVVEIAKERKVKYIFFETLVSPKLARVVADEVGAQMLVLNPGANMTKDQFDGGVTFLGILEENLENLKKGLECNG